jgi:hypothetical protein
MQAVHSTETSVNLYTYHKASDTKVPIVRTSDFVENALNDDNSGSMIAKLFTICELPTNQNFL